MWGRFAPAALRSSVQEVPYEEAKWEWDPKWGWQRHESLLSSYHIPNVRQCEHEDSSIVAAIMPSCIKGKLVVVFLV